MSLYIKQIEQKLLEVEGSKSDFDKELTLKLRTDMYSSIELRKNLYKEKFSLMLEFTSAAQNESFNKKKCRFISN